MNVSFIAMTNTFAPYDNPLVRQALAMGIDRQRIVDNFYPPGTEVASHFVPCSVPNGCVGHAWYDFDPEAARALLAEAGFPDGFETTLEIASGVQEAKEVAVWVQQSLAQIGIDVTIQELPGAAFTEKLQKHELGFFFFNNWISINNDPFYHLFWLFTADCCTYGKYQKPEVMDLVNKWINEPPDAPGREEASREAQRIIVEDAGWVFLYQLPHTYAMRKNVKGFTYYPAEGFIRYSELEKA